MQRTMGRLQNELDRKHARAQARIDARKAALSEQQRAERKAAFDAIEARRIAETREGQARFRPGLSGLWDRVRDAHKRVREQNEREAYAA